MSATTFEQLVNRTRLWPGESSVETGLTPTPRVYIPTPRVHYPLLDDESVCRDLLLRLNSFKRLIHPSSLLLFLGQHFYLVWQPPHASPIFVQLLIQEQVNAMQAGFLSAHPEATWTGDRWVENCAYLSAWGPGCRFGRSHLNDYRHVLERATLVLCELLHIEYLPRHAALHLIQIHRLQLFDTDEARSRIKYLQEAHSTFAKRRRSLANRDRKKHLRLLEVCGRWCR